MTIKMRSLYSQGAIQCDEKRYKNTSELIISDSNKMHKAILVSLKGEKHEFN
jgi:hypothetical protein